MIYACKRRENWYIKWEHYEEWKIILITKTSVMKEYLKYVFPRMRTCTEFQIEKGFRTSESYSTENEGCVRTYSKNY